MQSPKKVVRDKINLTIGVTRRLIGKNARLKEIVKNLILENINVQKVTNRDMYDRWIKKAYPDAIDLYEQTKALESMEFKPLISILVPTYNTDPDMLKECIGSVQAQTYHNWQLCIVDDASPRPEVRKIIKEFADNDRRISYGFRKKNGHISNASNDALKLAKGEFIGLLDHDDVLWPNALFEVVAALNKHPDLDFIYSDEEKVTRDRRDHQDPFFKTDWNPEFLESVNAITHLAVIRSTVMRAVGGFRAGFEGAQDWDLFFRVSQVTSKIYHIPKVLYSWRMSETSTAASTDAKPYVREAQKRAIEDNLKAHGYESAKVQRGMLRDYWAVVHPVVGEPKVSIVIPTKDLYKVLKRCVESIIAKSTYKNFEIVIIDTGSKDSKVFAWYKKIQKKHKNIAVHNWPEQPFSYARSCNFGASKSTGDYLVMLNNDTEVITPNWLELFLSDAQRQGIGAVGCKLYYPDGVHIQHAGIGIGFGGLAANALSMVHCKQMSGMQHLYSDTRHEVSAVTAACMMVKKALFDSIGGFDEKFRVTYNDVDLCLRLKERGLRIIYNPAIELLHHESISVGRPEDKKVRDTKEVQAAKRRFRIKYKSIIKYDPFLNPNIERTNARFEVSQR